MKDLLILSNEIRKETRKCVYLSQNKLMYPLTVETEKELDEPYVKNSKKIKNFKEETTSRLEKFDAYLPLLEKVMDPGYALEDIHILLLANEIAKTFLIGDVFYFCGVLYVEGKGYCHKEDVYEALGILRKPYALTLLDLVKMADFGIYMQNNNAVILDGVSYVAKSYKYFIARPTYETENLMCEGYLHNGVLHWVEFDVTKFVETKVDNNKVIRVLAEHKTAIESVIRGELLKGKSLRYKKFPYPVAILEDNELSYLVTLKG